ncbi:DUF2254 domain-containing protein [Roseivirga sp. BDSF3-8]|uniref:DUF2254 domain-containing protein n=1 Tax=Roseivirga sp. BDSF3-8 TaxID=3241598 RepID=UPI0035321D7E
MKSLLSPYKIKKLTLAIIHSIAFYPAIIAVGFFLLAIGAMYAEGQFGLHEAVEEVPYLAVGNPDTARSMLTTLAGGVISLMVFTFTMVMVVLNLTSTNYSPRVLPGLISSKPHQVVLGLFLGTITYTITVLSNIDSDYFEFVVPKLALVINAGAGAVSFIAFIYFIHHISRSIQVSNILLELHHKTLKVLRHEKENGQYISPDLLPDLGEEHVVHMKDSGFFHTLSDKNLIKLAKKHDVTIRLLVTKGMHTLKGSPFLKVNKPLDDEAKDAILSCVVFRNEELISQNHLDGIKQVTEIALKALSPGINDPGTALMALDYLADIYIHLIPLEGHKTVMQDGHFFIIYDETPVCEAIKASLMEILIYGKGDAMVMYKMKKHLETLSARYTEGKIGDCFREMDRIVDSEINKGGITPYIRPFLA